MICDCVKPADTGKDEETENVEIEPKYTDLEPMRRWLDGKCYVIGSPPRSTPGVKWLLHASPRINKIPFWSQRDTPDAFTRYPTDNCWIIQPHLKSETVSSITYKGKPWMPTKTIRVAVLKKLKPVPNLGVRNGCCVQCEASVPPGCGRCINCPLLPGEVRPPTLGNIIKMLRKPQDTEQKEKRIKTVCAKCDIPYRPGTNYCVECIARDVGVKEVKEVPSLPTFFKGHEEICSKCLRSLPADATRCVVCPLLPGEQVLPSYSEICDQMIKVEQTRKFSESEQHERDPDEEPSGKRQRVV